MVLLHLRRVIFISHWALQINYGKLIVSVKGRIEQIIH
eukprot:SAG11_NODE_7669_length_1112_cov_1.814413_2_plen_37_part_01